MRLLPLLLLAFAMTAVAKVTPDEAKKLGTTLTPLGSEQAGNAGGTIPAWDGGLPQQDMKRGDDPYAADKPLYTVTRANLKDYDKVLTEGYKALFRTFPDYKMVVYPTRRS